MPPGTIETAPAETHESINGSCITVTTTSSVASYMAIHLRAASLGFKEIGGRKEWRVCRMLAEFISVST